MKEILLKPRSIAGAITWGALSAFFVFVVLIIIDLVISTYTENFGPIQQIQSIAVGNGYSISLDAKPVHPWLAEYEQSITVYGGDPRNGNRLANLEIPTNTGGRVLIGVYVPKDKSNSVILVDRYSTSIIDLANLKVSPIQNINHEELISLGIISGQSYPIKFIPCSSWPLISLIEKNTIIHEHSEIKGICDAL